MAVTKKLSLTADVNGRNSFCIAPSSHQKKALLEVDVVDQFTVPSDYKEYSVIFSIQPGASVWVTYDGTTPAYPTGTFEDTTSEMNPAGRTVPGGTVIKMITSDSTAQIGAIMYGVF